LSLYVGNYFYISRGTIDAFFKKVLQPIFQIGNISSKYAEHQLKQFLKIQFSWIIFSCNSEYKDYFFYRVI